jgi:hypothetical protein
MKALPTNRLATSPHYQKILHQYNNEYERTGGRVNDSKFYRDIILPLIPGYHLQSWYQFLRRFKTNAGLVAVTVVNEGPRSIAKHEEKRLEQNTVDNEVATQMGINLALNIGAERLKEIFENPEIVTTKEASDLFFKAMKAQDSRIHAISKVKETNQKEEALQRLFNEAVYGGRD